MTELGHMKSEVSISELKFDHIPIEEQVVVMFPGQGAQFVRMGEKVSHNLLLITLVPKSRPDVVCKKHLFLDEFIA
jgi:hypothetical protein